MRTMPSNDLCAGDMLFKLGLMEAAGSRTDLVSAHKWFNLAALKGNKEAIRLRSEIALEMSQDEIAAAQRAARDWLTMIPPPLAGEGGARSAPGGGRSHDR